MSIQPFPRLPSPDQPVLDQRGALTVPWREYFERLDDRLRKLLVLFGTGTTTVGSLPSAASAGAGARAFVTDANATTFHSTVAAGGSNKVPVVSDGTNWLIG